MTMQKVGIFLIFQIILILHQLLEMVVHQTKVIKDLFLSTRSDFLQIFQNLFLLECQFISLFLKLKLSKSFSKNHITQRVCLIVIGTWNSMLSKGNKVRAIVTDFLKALDTLNLTLCLCTLKAYGFDTSALNKIQSYFSNTNQIIKVGDKFIKWQKLSTGVKQGHILGHLFFNTFY